MSWMFTRAEGLDAFVNLRPTMLDDPSWFTPFIETYTSEKPGWAIAPAVHGFEKFPAFDEFGGLIEEYAMHANNQQRDFIR
jgi:hypothetical protein